MFPCSLYRWSVLLVYPPDGYHVMTDQYEHRWSSLPSDPVTDAPSEEAEDETAGEM